MRVLFDTNALSKLCNGSTLSAEVLRRLRCEVRHGRAFVIACEPLLLEHAKSADGAPDKYAREQRELRALSRGRILLPVEHRLKFEVRARGLARDREAFLSRTESEKIFAKFERNHPERREYVEALERRLPAFGAEERAVKEQENALPRKDRKQRRQAWEREIAGDGLDALIDEHVIGRLESNIAQLGLPGDRSQSPTAREVPTLRAHAAYYVARANLVTIGDRGVKENDYVDHYFYADAPYADVLVTDDGPFHVVGEHTRTGSLWRGSSRGRLASSVAFDLDRTDAPEADAPTPPFALTQRCSALSCGGSRISVPSDRLGLVVGLVVVQTLVAHASRQLLRGADGTRLFAVTGPAPGGRV